MCLPGGQEIQTSQSNDRPLIWPDILLPFFHIHSGYSNRIHSHVRHRSVFYRDKKQDDESADCGAHTGDSIATNSHW